MKFLDQAKIYLRSGDGGERLRGLSAREVHRVRRAGRRRRRARRRRHRRMRRRPQHADRLSLRPAFPGRDRPSGHRAATAPAPRGKDIVLRLPRGTQIFDEDNETLLLDLTEIGQRVVLAQGRRRRLRQPALQDLDQPRAAPRRQGLAGRGALGLAAAEADRRCRPGRPAQRRQVDVPGGRHPTRGPRSPTIPSRRCIPASAW